jgi:hypothetical protein
VSKAADTSTSIIMSRRLAPILGHPDDVVRHPRLTVAEKREILARWASDAHAIEDVPALRQLDDGSVVAVDAILQALKSLDCDQGRTTAGRPAWKPYARKRGSLLSRLRIVRRRNDDDYDPPPCPASSAYPVRIELADARAA